MSSRRDPLLTALESIGAVKSTVLIVDDNPLVRGKLSKLVKSIDSNVEVVSKSSGEEASGYVDEHGGDVDLVLTDLEMPGIDGIELIRRLRNDSATAHVPVMMITVSDDREMRQRALEAGATDFLSRPLTPDETRARCRNLLQLSKYMRLMKLHIRTLERIQGIATTSLCEEQESVGERVVIDRKVLQDMTSALEAASSLIAHSRDAMGQFGLPMAGAAPSV